MVWVIRERLVAEGVGVRCTRAAPGRRHMHQPGRSQRYFSVLLYLDVVLFFAWQKTYAPARTQSAVLFCTSVSLDSTFLCLAEDFMHQPGRRLRYFSLNCASFRKKQYRGQGLKCTFLKYLLHFILCCKNTFSETRTCWCLSSLPEVSYALNFSPLRYDWYHTLQGKNHGVVCVPTSNSPIHKLNVGLW